MPAFNKPSKVNAYNRALWGDLKDVGGIVSVNGESTVIVDMHLAEALSMDYGVAGLYSNSVAVYLQFADDYSRPNTTIGLITPSSLGLGGTIVEQHRTSSTSLVRMAPHIPPEITGSLHRYVSIYEIAFVDVAAYNYRRYNGET